MTKSRSNRGRLHTSVFLAAVLLAGCGLDMGVDSGEVLFQDDFSRPMSGWDRLQDLTYSADYADGTYDIIVHAIETDVWSTPGLTFTDVQVQVEASKRSGPDDNIYGVICRYQDPRNFYFFVISSDGYAGIGLNKDGRRQLLSGEALFPSSTVRQGVAGNVIRADCIGYDLRLYVNGVLAAQARAAEWDSGDVGLLAGTYALPDAHFVFDNFSVVQP